VLPLGQIGRPKDYGAPAVFLASLDSDCIVAETLNVDGGNWMIRPKLFFRRRFQGKAFVRTRD
jgi:NAD(P)-dependent dehydrogenase (short-subunit alcohol dehydrogenase family)